MLTPRGNEVPPFWTLWAWLTAYQREGMEWETATALTGGKDLK